MNEGMGAPSQTGVTLAKQPRPARTGLTVYCGGKQNENRKTKREKVRKRANVGKYISKK